MRTWTFSDRRPAGDGPWRDEPDKAQWIDETTDLDCLAHRAPSGAWCGYVGVPPGHPWHGKDCLDINVVVHGGLNYSSHCQEVDEAGPGICHVAEPGRPVNVWWLGFDCGHAGDLCPQYLPYHLHERGTYRPLEYVRAEVTSLAEQVAKAR